MMAPFLTNAECSEITPLGQVAARDCAIMAARTQLPTAGLPVSPIPKQQERIDTFMAYKRTSVRPNSQAT
eukprot:m.100875 g.100875  ORF g.100875 m.100875 type:complete len:70 (-) comp13185_c1_seq3:133-342(-)